VLGKLREEKRERERERERKKKINENHYIIHLVKAK
jgi:hypothetical protein